MAQQYESREDRVPQIARAALELIAESGLRGFTTKAIAAKVGITDGTIFRHFKNKEEIVLAAIDLLEEAMFGEGFPDDEDPLRRLENFFRQRAGLLGQDAALCRLMFSEELPQASGDLGAQKLKSWRDRNMAFVGQCLEELSLPQELEARDVAVLVQGTLLTFVFERAKPAPDELEERIERAWRTLAHLFKS